LRKIGKIKHTKSDESSSENNITCLCLSIIYYTLYDCTQIVLFGATNFFDPWIFPIDPGGIWFQYVSMFPRSNNVFEGRKEHPKYEEREQLNILLAY